MHLVPARIERSFARIPNAVKEQLFPDCTPGKDFGVPGTTGRLFGIPPELTADSIRAPSFQQRIANIYEYNRYSFVSYYCKFALFYNQLMHCSFCVC